MNTCETCKWRGEHGGNYEPYRECLVSLRFPHPDDRDRACVFDMNEIDLGEMLGGESGTMASIPNASTNARVRFGPDYGCIHHEFPEEESGDEE